MKKAAHAVMWSPAPDKPIFQTLLFNFPSTIPNHSDVWIDRTSTYPKKGKTNT